MKNMINKMAVYLIIITFSMLIFSCGDLPLSRIDPAGFNLFNLNLDNVPYAPKVISSSSSSRALSTATGSEYEGVSYGNLLALYNAGSNYNMTLWFIESLSDQDGGEEYDITEGAFTTRVDYPDGKIYQNADLSNLSVVMKTMDPGEIIQLDYKEFPNYTYAGIIFYRVNVGNMIDFTEIWEYSDRKEISVTKIYAIGTASQLNTNFASITELVSGIEKTTAVSNTGGPSRTYYNTVGILDLNMSAVLEGIDSFFTTEYDNGVATIKADYTDYPDPDDVLTIWNKSVSTADLLTVSLDINTLNRFSGFDD